MTTTSLDFRTPADEPTIIVRRFLKAPPALVFDAFTKPEYLVRWWGPRRLELSVRELDLRVGGSYRFVHRAPDGQEFGFHGEYQEIDPPHRLVTTFIYEGAPDHMAIETLTLEAVDGGTMLETSARHASMAARDMHVANGMEEGLADSMDRLDELMAALQSS
jgi:uncharacterized protein YndB with AHSA1/START domain